MKGIFQTWASLSHQIFDLILVFILQDHTIDEIMDFCKIIADLESAGDKTLCVESGTTLKSVKIEASYMDL